MDGYDAPSLEAVRVGETASGHLTDRSRRESAGETVGGTAIETMIELLLSADAVVSCDQERARQIIDRVVEILRMTMYAYTDQPPPKPTTGRLAPWQERRLKAYIENNLSIPMTTADLADVVNLSRSYFCRAFKESFGRAPHAYLTMRRTVRAQEMMLMTDEPLSQIAVACGSVDQAHFCKLFRRTVGSNPRAWRKALKRAGQDALDRPVEMRTG